MKIFPFFFFNGKFDGKKRAQPRVFSLFAFTVFFNLLEKIFYV